jgi:hypothetical protein
MLNHSVSSTSLHIEDASSTADVPSASSCLPASRTPDSPRRIAIAAVRPLYKSIPLPPRAIGSPPPLASDRVNDAFWCVGDAPARWDISLSVQIVSQLRRLLPRTRVEITRPADRRAA